MYLPAAIPFRDTASYDNADLGMAGGIAETAGRRRTEFSGKFGYWCW